MNIRSEFTDASTNGEWLLNVSVIDDDSHKGIASRMVRADSIEDLDAFTSEVETALGSETAGNVRSEIEKLAKDRPAARHPSSSFHLVSAGNLVDAHPDERPYLFEGLLRQGETANIVASPKSYKSFLAMSIALCVCAGLRLFGMYQARKGRVLLIDNELHPETLAHRITKVASAMGIPSDVWRSSINVVTLRGQNADINRLGALFRSIQRGTYALIILDALYRLWPADCEENSNSHVTKIYNTIDQYAESTGAAIICVHHSSKGSQGNKAVTDTGSGAGAQSRAPDGHWVIRQHEEADCAVLDAVLRSSAPVPPLGLRWKYPLWVPDPELDVTQLKRDRGPGGRPRKTDANPEEAAPNEPWDPERFASEFVTAAPIRKDVLTSKAHRAGLTFRAIEGLIAEAESAGIIHRYSTGKTTGIAYANAPQDLFEGDQNVKRERTHTPHTPQWGAA